MHITSLINIYWLAPSQRCSHIEIFISFSLENPPSFDNILPAAS